MDDTTVLLVPLMDEMTVLLVNIICVCPVFLLLLLMLCLNWVNMIYDWFASLLLVLICFQQ